jgi:hypothetical protein
MRYYKIWPIIRIFFHGYVITLWPFGVFSPRDPVKLTQYTKNHESIHWKQQKELPLVFYLWYIIEYLIKFFKYGPCAYYEISFEREAFNNAHDLGYLKNRKSYSWMNYI